MVRVFEKTTHFFPNVTANVAPADACSVSALPADLYCSNASGFVLFDFDGSQFVATPWSGFVADALHSGFSLFPVVVLSPNGRRG
jgi:hypothetical protein